MTLKHMRIFIAVCEEESVTGAAKKLFLSQPAVSLALRELEEHYGIKFFERFARKIQITESGKVFYNYASHILQLYGQMDQELSAWNNAGSLRVGSSITIGTCMMPALIHNFKLSHPQLRPYVKIDSSDVIETLILQNKLDLALIEGTVHSENIHSEKILDDHLVAICSTRNPLKNKASVTLTDLAHENLLLREPNSGTRELIESVFTLHGCPIHPAWESTSTESLLNAVTANLGISILPYRLITTRIRKQKVILLPLEDVEFKRSFHVVYHKNKFLTQAAQEFITYVKEELQKLEDLPAAPSS